MSANSLSIYCSVVFLVTILKCQSSIAFQAIDFGSQPNLVHKVRVIGKDERRPLDGAAADGVGIVYHREKKGACTAFCVAADVIASNAHCLIRRPSHSKDVDLSTVIFALRRRQGVVPADPRLQEISRLLRSIQGRGPEWKISRLKYADKAQPMLSVYAGYYRGRRSVSEFSNDWAFAKIENPVCEGKSLPILAHSRSKVIAASRSTGPFLIGYHGDKSFEQRWLSPSCYLYTKKDLRFLHPQHRHAVSASRNLYVHECDMREGASGAPILIDLGNGAQVFAINAGSLTFQRYQVDRRTRRRHTTSRHTANYAVGISEFVAGVERFKSETLISGIDDLRELQELLSKAGLYGAAVDSIFGAGTRSAILKYEQGQGLARLGIPTSQLLSLLRKQYQPSERAREQIRTPPPVTEPEISMAAASRKIDAGDIRAARVMLARLASEGNSEAMFRLAETFDPNYLLASNSDRLPAIAGGERAEPNMEKARMFYSMALNLGVTKAKARIDALQ